MRVKYTENKHVYYKRNPIIGERRRDDETVLIDSETDAIIHLNAMGQRIYKCVENTVSKERIIENCAEYFSDVPHEILRRDVVKLIDQLVDRQILLQVSEQTYPVEKAE